MWYALPMANDSKSFRMLAKTLYGLEDSLAEEIASIGGVDIKTYNRAVEFSGDKELLYRANISCRLATRILKPIYQFKTTDADSLYQNVKRINWDLYLTAKHTLAIDTVVSHSSFTNSMFVAQRAKDAIVDQFRKRTGERPTVDIQNPDLRINLHIHENDATLSLDSTGTPLSRRGYRTESGQAPIGEVLAAGILDIIGWNGEKPLVDPMCGSGTFVIEAAMRRLKMIPGELSRDYAFMRWLDYDDALYRKIKGENSESRDNKENKENVASAPGGESGEKVAVYGYDSDSRQLRYAQANAARAGVGASARFGKRDFFDDDYSIHDSVVVLNPPYDKRLGLDDVKAFYKLIGNTLKAKYVDSTVYIITANLDGMKSIGLKATRKVKLYNGPLECRLLEYQMFSGRREDHLRTK